MDSINELFDSEIQGDPSGALDADIAASAQWLQKIAEADGIDLDSLPAADVADLLLKVSGREPVPEPQDDKTKEANMTTPKQITNVDVSRELHKVAAREGIDISTVSEEEYAQAWDKLAAAMQSPDWEARQEAEKQAAEEAKAHYDIGVKIAQGFIDSVNSHFEKKAEDGEDGEKKPPPFMKKDEKKDEESKDDEESKESALASGAPAGGDDEVEALALKIARQTIVDNGFDPDTGEKLSAEQKKLAAAEARALELLKEKNWI